MDNLDFIMSCFNQYCFQDAKNGIEEIEYYLTTNPSTQGNKLIDELVYAIKTYSLDTIDLPLFQSICTKCNKTEAETRDIIDRLVLWKTYNKDKIAPTKQFIRDIIANSILQKGTRLYGSSPSEFLKYCKTSEFREADEDLIKESKFGEIDINSIIAEDAATIIPSIFPFINNSYSSGGYNMGEMILFCSVPGSGKSLFALQECLHIASMGPLPGKKERLKVGMFLLGDLNMKDQILRAAAIYSGLPFKEARANLSGIYRSMCGVIGDNFTIITAPAGELSVDDVIDISNARGFDVIAIDYDSNLKCSSSGSYGDASMYQDFGEIYTKLTKITAQNKLLFVLSQPKINVWQDEVVNMSALAESSRKQHTADTIITRGQFVDCPNYLGIMQVTKCRRGDPNTRSYSIRLNNGRFITDLPKAMYEDLKREKNKIFYTESDIDQMIQQYKRQEIQISQSLGEGFNKAVEQQKSQLSGPNPFIGKV